MKKCILITIVLVFSMISAASSWATVIELGVDGYTMPDGYSQVAEYTGVSLDHYQYYKWAIDDLSGEVTGVDIVFHNVYNWADEDWDQLAVYLIDDTQTNDGQEWTTGYLPSDYQSTTIPDWSGSGWTLIGTWSDLDDNESSSDVVFSISDPAILSYLSNGGTFTIGIDPDCHYYLDGITVYAGTSADPVPEPATMLLLGTGLIGMAGISRKKLRRK